MSSDLQIPLDLDLKRDESAPGAAARERRQAAERRRRELGTALPELTPVEPDAPAFLRPDRRIRQRRARRGPLGRWLRPLQAALGALVLAGAAWAGYSRVMASERLRVTHLDVRGGHFLSDPEVKELLGPAVGENILSLDIEGLKRRLRASPWVAEASVVRTLPDTLRVEIREREPLALAEVDRLYLMDEEGSLIDLYGPRTSVFDLPIVRGLSGLDGDTRRARAERAGALLRDLGDLSSEVSEVQPEANGDLRVVLRGAGEVLLLGEPPCRDRLQGFLALRAQLGERVPDAEYFDLRFDGRIYAKPRHQPKAAVETTNPAPAAAVAAVPEDPALTAETH